MSYTINVKRGQVISVQAGLLSIPPDPAALPY
jgi:hypothetical protein